jgi:hypothetical protein
MTLNQVINRIQALCLGHKQLRNFYRGLVDDFLTDKTTNYPSAFLQDNGGKISTSGHATTLAFRLFFLDLENVSENTALNAQDVQSDMVLVAMDIVAQMNAGMFDDWALSTDNTLQLLYEDKDDVVAGCYVDFSLRIMFTQDLCQIPTNYENQVLPEDMKLVYDMEYVATGAEGTALVIPGLAGERILLIVRGGNPLHKVSNNPDSTNYVWDNTTITLGTKTVAGERFLILYRNY